MNNREITNNNSNVETSLHDLVAKYVIGPIVNKVTAHDRKEANDTFILKFVDLTDSYDSKKMYAAITQKNDAGETILHQVVKTGNVKISKFILRFISHDNKQHVLKMQDNNGDTILHHILFAYREKFFDFLNLISPEDHFEILTLIKNNNSDSVLSIMENDDAFDNYINQVYAAFTKISALINPKHKSLTKKIIKDALEDKKKLQYIIDLNDNGINESLKLAFQHYDNCNIQNGKLFRTLYVRLVDYNYKFIWSPISMPTIQKIQVGFENLSNDQLTKFLANEIKILQLKYEHADFEIFDNRQKLLDFINNNPNNVDEVSIHQLKDTFLIFDTFILDVFKASFIYYSSPNPERNIKKRELLNELTQAYNNCFTCCSIEQIKQLTHHLVIKCRELVNEIEKNHGTTPFSKNVTKSRLASSMNDVINNHVKIIAEAFSPRTIDLDELIDENDMEKKQLIKKVNAFELIYKILYDYYPLAKHNFITEKYKSFPDDIKYQKIYTSKDPLVVNAFLLANEHFDHIDSKNNELILKIYEHLDSKFYITFSVLRETILTIINRLEQINNLELTEKNNLSESCSNVVCHIKVHAFKQSKQISDTELFDLRDSALKSLQSSDIINDELVKNFNRLDMRICSLLKVYVKYNPKENQYRIASLGKLIQEAKNAYQECIPVFGSLDSDEIKRVEEKFINKCKAVAEEVEEDHRKHGQLALVGTESKLAKAIYKALEDVNDTPQPNKINLFKSLITTRLASQNSDQLLHKDLSEDNNEKNDLVKFDEIILKLNFSNSKLNRLFKEELQKKENKSQSNDNSTTGDIKKTQTYPRFLARSEIDADKVEFINNLVNCIVSSKQNLINEFCDFQTVLSGFKTFLEYQINTLRNKSVIKHSETANDLAKFIEKYLPKAVKEQDYYNVPKVNMK